MNLFEAVCFRFWATQTSNFSTSERLNKYFLYCLPKLLISAVINCFCRALILKKWRKKVEKKKIDFLLLTIQFFSLYQQDVKRLFLTLPSDFNLNENKWKTQRTWVSFYAEFEWILWNQFAAVTEVKYGFTDYNPSCPFSPERS